MERADLLQYLDFIVSNQDVTRAKPDPEMYNLAIERLGVAPGETLILEDNENGLRAARASGAHILQVQDVADVNWASISRRITECDEAAAA